MQHASIIVRADWDEEASVWIATSSDIKGLVAEADTLENLKEKVLVMVVELLELNEFGYDAPEIPVHIMSEQVQRIRNPRAA